MKQLLLISIVALFAMNIQSQSIGWAANADQRLNNPIFSNPALIGWHGGVGVYTNTQFQRLGFEGHPGTHQMGVDGYVNKLRTAFAVNYTGDGVGQLYSDVLTLVVSPKLKLGDELYLMPSLSYNIEQLSLSNRGMLNPTRIGKSDVWNRGNGFQFGLAFLANGFFASATALIDNYNSRDIYYSEPFYNGVAGYRFRVGESWSILPTVSIISHRQSHQIRIASNVQYKFLFVAPFYAYDDRVGCSAGVTIKERVRLSGSYAIHTSRLAQGSSGSFEFGLHALLFKDKVKRRFMENLPVM